MSREPGATGLIVRLKNLPHLRKLELRHTSVTDAGLAHLKEVKTLEFLRLPDANIGYLAFGWLTMGQLLSLPMLIAGLAMLAWALRNKQRSGNYA